MPRVLLVTEGTYPYAVGGVSSWCDLLVESLTDFDWQVLPIVAPHGRPPLYELPAHAREVGRDRAVVGGAARAARPRAAERAAGRELPGGARARPDRLGRRHRRGARGAGAGAGGIPAGVRRVFRSRRGWAAFLDGLRDGPRRARRRRPGRRRRSTSSRPRRSTRRCTGSRAPRPRRRPHTDVLHVTAAGWAAIPALVHKALHGTPMVLTEHGVYVREAYLAAARSGASPGARFAATRLARGLARAGLRRRRRRLPRDRRQRALGGGARRRPGEDPRALQRPAPPRGADRRRRGTRTVVSVGRIDPLKDVHTMLRVAAETLRVRARRARSCTTGR